MDPSVLAATVSLPPPVPAPGGGLHGLGIGYMIYGSRELSGYPKRAERADFATGM